MLDKNSDKVSSMGRFSTEMCCANTINDMLWKMNAFWPTFVPGKPEGLGMACMSPSAVGLCISLGE